ncbi:MAG: pilus assembly protein TadG-related protein [Planctomycetota bacterium]|jgi:hypothetical protein
MRRTNSDSASERRRAALAVTAAVFMTVLMGFAALAVDVGHLYVVKGELQRSADVAALAGASAFTDNSLHESLYGESPDYTLVTAEGSTRAALYAAQNPARGVVPLLGTNDIVFGWYDFDDPSAPLDVGGQPNAVQVTARFTGDSPNGPVANFFAQVMGFFSTDVSARATAAFDDRFAGYTPDVPGVLTPFTIEINTFEYQRVNGPDNFSYDEVFDLVESFGDGTSEIVLYPYADDGGGDGAGNFGLLTVGNPVEGVYGTSELREQILNGITPAEIEAEIGTPEVTFIDTLGNPTTYDIDGDPGMKGGVEEAVEARVGDVIGYFLHSTLVQGGANAIYTVVQLRFGRVMEVDLLGNPAERRVVVQPMIYSGPGVRTSADGASSGGLVGRLVMVR